MAVAVAAAAYLICIAIGGMARELYMFLRDRR